MREIIEKQCKKSFPKFMERAGNVPWQERSILMSEAFAFCAIGDLFDIDVIIESGIYLGRSTEIWANYFSDKSIYAIDCKLKQEAVERLKGYNNVILIEGDGFELLKQLSAKLAPRRIGIFMDGPKGCKALRFGLDISKHQNVEFFALHDVHKMKRGKRSEVRELFEILTASAFFTDEKWFVDNYSEIDKNESNWDGQQGLIWMPFKLISKDGNHNRVLGSYGPTIGFAFN